MGFDPRHWSATASAHASRDRSTGGERVTSNVEALLRENEALRREIERLQLELDRSRRQQWQRPRHNPQSYRSWQEPSAQAPPRVTAAQVQRWGESLAEQSGWSVLRSKALNALIDQINRSSFHAQLSLQQRLDRLVSGLGTDLLKAIGERPSKRSTAVLAAFALYGVRASEWLDEDPARVVADLRQRLQWEETSNSGRRTRSDRRRTDRAGSDHHGSHQSWPYDSVHASRSHALAVLGLQDGATQDAIKQAFRKLVKRHHPDVGGSSEAFRRVNEAYQLLTS